MSNSLSPKWISKEQVLYIHNATIARHGGTIGLRDVGLLESALARPENHYAYGEQDIFILAATYAEGIARNHAFIDGNKRTAYTVSGLFLRLNGYYLKIPSVPKQIALFENVSMGQVTRDKLAQFYRDNTTAKDITKTIDN